MLAEVIAKDDPVPFLFTQGDSHNPPSAPQVSPIIDFKQIAVDSPISYGLPPINCAVDAAARPAATPTST